MSHTGRPRSLADDRRCSTVYTNENSRALDLRMVHLNLGKTPIIQAADTPYCSHFLLACSSMPRSTMKNCVLSVNARSWWFELGIVRSVMVTLTYVKLSLRIFVLVHKGLPPGWVP